MRTSFKLLIKETLSMHTKSELESMTLEQLQEIAKGLNIPVKSKSTKLDIVYSIIDEESMQVQPAEKPAPKKRGRKSKAEKEANEATPMEPAAKTEAETVQEDTATAPTGDAASAKPAPKKRGRKSKAEKEAMEAAAKEAAMAQQATLFDQAEANAQTGEPNAKTAPTASVTLQEEQALQESQPTAEATDLPEALTNEEVSDKEDAQDKETSEGNAADGPTPAEVEAFFNANEPDFIVVQPIPALDGSNADQDVAIDTEPWTKMEEQPRFSQAQHTPMPAAEQPHKAPAQQLHAEPAAHYDFGNMVKICHNQCMLCPTQYISTYSERGNGRSPQQVTLEEVMQTVKSWLFDAEHRIVTERAKIERMKQITVSAEQMFMLIGMLTTIRVKCDSRNKQIHENRVYPLNQSQISDFTEQMLIRYDAKRIITAWDIYDAATELYKAFIPKLKKRLRGYLPVSLAQILFDWPDDSCSRQGLNTCSVHINGQRLPNINYPFSIFRHKDRIKQIGSICSKGVGSSSN